MTFRPCGDCNACCEGTLRGTAHGNLFGEGRTCVFLVHKACAIHATRPPACKNYQCAWSQHLFPEWMQPHECGVMISVETHQQQQFLKVIELRPMVSYQVYAEIDRFCKLNNTYYVKAPHNEKT